jgi:hypothetical protein
VENNLTLEHTESPAGGRAASPAIQTMDAAGGCGCAKCAGASAPLGYVYAVGAIEARFPSRDIEKEFRQVITERDTLGITEGELLYAVLSRGENLYLAREMCWVFHIAGIDTYILQPRSQVELTDMIAAISPNLMQIEYDVVIGLRGGNAPPQMCNGLELPVVMVNQVYSFTMGQFAENVPLPKRPEFNPTHPNYKEAVQKFRDTVPQTFGRMRQLADNAGETDEHRALNYVSLRYPNIYSLSYEKENLGENSLTGVEVLPSRLAGARQVKDVVFTFTNRSTSVQEKYFTRVDVTGQFPFLVSPLQIFYDR